MSYGTAPISGLQRGPISQRGRSLVSGNLLFALLCLTGAGGGGAVAEDVPLPRPRPRVWVEPHTFREAAGPNFNSTEVTNAPTDCNQRLQAIAVIELLPRLIGPDACGGGDIVRLQAVIPAGNGSRIELRPAPILRCAFAESVAGWMRDEAAPQSDKLGAPLRAVETYDAFECRGRNRVAGAKLSEHGKANAVDLRSFTLADGRTLGLTDVKAAKEFRDEIRDSACRRFTTVLGPGSDGYHESHIHLDLIERRNGFRMCQWDVRTAKAEVTAQTSAQGIRQGASQESSQKSSQDIPQGIPQLSAQVPLPLPRPAIADSRPRHSRKL
jgi:hypothetical protein